MCSGTPKPTVRAMRVYGAKGGSLNDRRPFGRQKMDEVYPT